MRLDIVTPERQLASLEIDSVQIPGMNGDMTVMANHAPFLTTLRPGVVIVNSKSGREEFVVTGGFAEISPESASILAEMALPKGEVQRDTLEAVLSEAKAAHEAAADADKPAAAQRINDMGQLIHQHVG